jgi:hypothetical protein
MTPRANSIYLAQCITSEQPPTNPCAYCKRKGFHCEYVVVTPGRRVSTTYHDHAGDNPKSATESASWKPPSPNPASSSGHLTPSLPGSYRASSSDSTFPSLPTRRRKVRHRPTIHPAPGQSRPSGLAHTAPPANQLYNLQTIHALEYISNHASRSQPSALSASPPAEYFAEDVQMPDFDFSATDMYAWALEG